MPYKLLSVSIRDSRRQDNPRTPVILRTGIFRMILGKGDIPTANRIVAKCMRKINYFVVEIVLFKSTLNCNGKNKCYIRLCEISVNMVFRTFVTLPDYVDDINMFYLYGVDTLIVVFGAKCPLNEVIFRTGPSLLTKR